MATTNTSVDAREEARKLHDAAAVDVAAMEDLIARVRRETLLEAAEVLSEESMKPKTWGNHVRGFSAAASMLQGMANTPGAAASEEGKRNG